ncbi:MAG TPA: acyl-CoA dehydrogenase family protein [Candidatus Dormibacteraeota bacterium]|nr:acyl-CoA dehydrogenase family protein [Candidatus Dormibacteraeota bacterium]
MTWDFSTELEFEKKLEWMRRFMHDEVLPLEVLDADMDGFMRAIRPLQEEVKRQKLWATHLPPELGGQGYGQVKLGLMHEIEGASMWGPIIFGNQAPDSGNSEILAQFGTEEQKQRWLYPLLDGKIRSGFSMTEPETAGSDPTLLAATAELDGDEWVINGHKWFTTNGMVASFLIAMVITEPNADRYERASMIIVPTDAPGLKRVRNVPTMGGDERFGFGHAEVIYENCRVPAANVLGERGQGFLIAQARLGPGRIHHCMRWLGQARRAFDMMCERSLQREAFGKKLASHQTVQNWIADSAAEMQAARLMTLHAAWVIDTQGASAARKEISLIKFYGAKVLHDVIDRAIQLHGGLGYSSDLPLEEMYRHARAARIYDGPDEVHRVSVARQILAGYRQPEGIWPREHIPTRREAARRKFAALLEAATTDA